MSRNEVLTGIAGSTAKYLSFWSFGSNVTFLVSSVLTIMFKMTTQTRA